ncbi:MAG: RNA polymerase sigma factor [Oscillospiraceae bacterium]|nr:RNA polymerase sigma factor [Oscillospiraceae bacterium]
MFLMTTVSAEETKRRTRAHAQNVDENLILRISSGDTEALEALYMQTKSAVFGFTLSILHNWQNAEDVLQDVYLRIWDAAASYHPQGKPMAWILTITRNLSLMKLRDRERQHFSLIEQVDSLTDEDVIDDRLNRVLIQTALDALAEEEREIVVLHALSGLKHREIADLLALPLSTVLSKYRRALAKLKLALKEGE